MVRINPKSIFEKVDLDDAASIRRIMVALDYLLTNIVLKSAAPELRAIEGDGRNEERSVVNFILARIRMMPDHLLLLKATLHFVEFRDESDEEVLKAAQELETLAPGNVLTVPQAFLEKYEAAEDEFNNKPIRLVRRMPIYLLNRTLKEKVCKFSHYNMITSDLT